MLVASAERDLHRALEAAAHGRVVEHLAAGLVHLAGRAHQRELHTAQWREAQSRRTAGAEMLVEREPDIEDVEGVGKDAVILALSQVRVLEIDLTTKPSARNEQGVGLDPDAAHHTAVGVLDADLAAAA